LHWKRLGLRGESSFPEKIEKKLLFGRKTPRASFPGIPREKFSLTKKRTENSVLSRVIGVPKHQKEALTQS